jgi:hypothetical protein
MRLMFSVLIEMLKEFQSLNFKLPTNAVKKVQGSYAKRNWSICKQRIIFTLVNN